jgi:hypothetical protein
MPYRPVRALDRSPKGIEVPKTGNMHWCLQPEFPMDQTFHGEIYPYRGGSLSDARVIMAILHVLTVNLLCQVVMGRVPVLECRLPVPHGCLWLHLVMSGFK